MRKTKQAATERPDAETRKLKRLHAAIDVGLADLARGDYIELEPKDIAAWLSELGRKAGRRRRSLTAKR